MGNFLCFYFRVGVMVGEVRDRKVLFGCIDIIFRIFLVRWIFRIDFFFVKFFKDIVVGVFICDVGNVLF